MLTGALAAILILLLYTQQRNAKAVQTEDKFILKFHSAFGVIAILLLTFGVALPYFYWSKKGYDLADMAIIIVISIVFVATAFWTLLVSKNHHVLYNDAEIQVFGITKSVQKFTWADISAVTLNGLTNNYVLTLTSGEKVKIYRYLMGTEDFIKKTGKFNRAS